MSATMWAEMFSMSMPLLERIVRPILVYTFLVIAFKLAGKRELAQLNPFDLIVLLILSETVQNAIVGEDQSVTGGLLGAAVLITVNSWFVRFLFKRPKVQRLLEGQPEVLVENGRVREEQCRKELVTRAELEEGARKHGIESLEGVEKAVLEPGGSISFIEKQSTPEEARHKELLVKFDELAAALDQLRAGRQTA